MAFKVTTKTGDDGFTNFGNYRVSKASDVIEVIGSIDTLDALLGTYFIAGAVNVQNDIRQALYEIMSDIYLRNEKDRKFDGDRYLILINGEIEVLRKSLSPSAACEFVKLHGAFNLTRTQVREAERAFARWEGSHDPFFKNHKSYLNRLSDYFYLLALRDSISLNTRKVIEVESVDMNKEVKV